MATNEADRYWAKIVGQAAVAVAGASDALLRVQLYDTLEEFFDGSNCWTRTSISPSFPRPRTTSSTPHGGRILRLDSVLDQNNVPQQAVMPEIGTVHFLLPLHRHPADAGDGDQDRHRSAAVLPAQYPGLGAAGAWARDSARADRQHDAAAGAELLQSGLGEFPSAPSSTTACPGVWWRRPR